MTKDPFTLEAEEHCPALVADAPIESVSPRYKFQSSATIVDGMRAHGWNFVGVLSVRVRTRTARFAPHVMTFEKGTTPEGYTPRIVIRNGHDGATGIQVRLGFAKNNDVFVAGQEFFGLNLRHMNAGVGLLGEFLAQADRNIDTLYHQVEAMRHQVLTESEKAALWRRAQLARWNDPDKSRAARSMDLATILEGVGETLFDVFRRYQQVILEGGFYKDVENKKYRKVRAIRSGVREVKFRQEIWRAATDFMRRTVAA